LRTTLKDVADKVGMAPSTVSRALAGRSGVSEDTRQLIFRVAEELDYKPNELARGLVRSSANIIGSLIMEFSNPFFLPVIEAIEDVADKHDYIAVIGETRRRLDVEVRLVERLCRVRVAGCLITPTLDSIKHLLAMRREGIPVVAVGRSCAELDYVSGDDLSGGIMVGQYLLELGHKRIAYVCNSELFNEPQRSRRLGLQRACAQGGIECGDDCCVKVEAKGVPAGQAAAERILEMSPRPTAIFAATDRLAIGLIHRLRQLGVQIPGDMAVVGYDNIPIADYLEVPLTTVSYSEYEMGKLAANMLFERIEGRGLKQIEQIRLQPELVLRQSSGGHSANVSPSDTNRRRARVTA
jgi:DNA-binding LacI/PurR family transcriptional regulator